MRRTGLAVAVSLVVVASGCGSSTPSNTAASAAASAATTTALDISLTEYKIQAPTTLHSGKVTLRISNDGDIPHELLVFRPSIAPQALPVDDHGDVKEDAATANKVSDGDNIDPHASQAREVDLARPGTYVLVCNLPGHYKLGMWTEVTVGYG